MRFVLNHRWHPHLGMLAACSCFFCCGLPALLALAGGGAAIVGSTWLSQMHGYIQTFAAVMLLLSARGLWRMRQATVCPVHGVAHGKTGRAYKVRLGVFLCSLSLWGGSMLVHLFEHV